jgi:3-oxoacyl-[acyl-carrier protein] reductase
VKETSELNQNNSTICLITGTRKGIGRYLAEYYLEKGFQVVGCSREASSLKHEHYQHFCLDIADEKAVRDLFSTIRKKGSSLEVLINNAGIASMNHSLLTPASSVLRILETNVIGTFLFCREAAKLMKANKNGRIVNFTTVAVPLKLEGEAIYAASKAAVISLTQILAKEFAEFNITVNALGPTPVKTDLIRNIPETKLEALLAQQTLRRFGEYEDVSNAIDFFIQPASDFITGQVLFLGGV